MQTGSTPFVSVILSGSRYGIKSRNLSLSEQNSVLCHVQTKIQNQSFATSESERSQSEMRTLPIVGKLTVLTPLGATRRPPLYKTWDVSCIPEFPVNSEPPPWSPRMAPPTFRKQPIVCSQFYRQVVWFHLWMIRSLH